MNAVHISTVRKMLQAPDPVDLTLWVSPGRYSTGTDVSRSAMTSTKARVA